MNFILITVGKILSLLIRKFNLGNGSTWPGHIALKFNSHFINDLLNNSSAKVILITGTNGKTTTAKLIETILRDNRKKVYSNMSGANLLNGIASLLIKKSKNGKVDADYLIFEVDENVVPLIPFSPDYVIALNLFRDQLDRYGEIDTISKNWARAYKNFSEHTKFILNCDDPQIYYLSKDLNQTILFFGLNEESNAKHLEHAADSIICPNCGSNLSYKKIYYSHLGKWYCQKCGLKPHRSDVNGLKTYPVPGVYNKYNTLASILFCEQTGIRLDKILKSLKNFTPAFGRQEELEYNGKKIKLFLAKNPTSFNESLRTIETLHAKNILFVLNDRIPDGTDVSWIWDVDFEMVSKNTKLYVSGNRVYDLALRLKYADLSCDSYENLNETINSATKNLSIKDILYILPTYSAMLDVRKILTGKKIL